MQGAVLHDRVGVGREREQDILRHRGPRLAQGARRGRAHGGVDIVVNFTGGDTWFPSLRCLKRA